MVTAISNGRSSNPGEAFGGSGHHLAAAGGMHVHHPHSHIGGRGARRRDSVGDIVVFEIEKDLRASGRDPLNEWGRRA